MTEKRKFIPLPQRFADPGPEQIDRDVAKDVYQANQLADISEILGADIVFKIDRNGCIVIPAEFPADKVERRIANLKPQEAKKLFLISNSLVGHTAVARIPTAEEARTGTHLVFKHDNAESYVKSLVDRKDFDSEGEYKAARGNEIRVIKGAWQAERPPEQNQ